jgi:hypothetical protein
MIFNVGAGGNNAVYLTQAEYDALPDSKLSNGVEYRITDANVGESIASNLAYDNTYSGIQAVNVQTAIDEVNDSLMTPFVDYSANILATITTPGGSWTATKDCICIASMGATSGNSANVLVDGMLAIATGLVTSSTSTYPYLGTCYVKKGQVVTTKNVSGHKYNLLFRPLLK